MVNGCKVLCVDDEKIICDLLAEFLSLAGYTPIKAYSGNSAVEILKREQVHMIITDLLMNDGNGKVVVDYVLSKNPSARPHIIVMSGLSESSLLAEIKAQGISDTLVKPVKLPNILNLMKKFQVR